MMPTDNFIQALSPLLSSFLSSMWPFFIFIVVLWLFRLPVVKGIRGEMWVNFVLRHQLSKEEYFLFKNVTLEIDDDSASDKAKKDKSEKDTVRTKAEASPNAPKKKGTTQIDHVLLSRYGIFVIETKNMKGWIFGSEKQRTWTQKIYRHSNQFMNPLRQNYKHVLALAQCLNLPKDALFSVVTFVGDATIKTKVPENVGYTRDMLRFIRSKKDILFTETELSHFKSLLNSGRLKPGLKTHRRHVNHVKRIINAQQKQGTKEP